MIAKAHRKVNGYLPASAYNQVDRILISDNGFYYKTAEGAAEGLFVTEGEAMYEFNNYIRVSTLQKELDIKKRKGEIAMEMRIKQIEELVQNECLLMGLPFEAIKVCLIIYF